ncbi:hypothetical protein ACVW0I_003374 [Bradyrhizobium sp. LM6.11]
MTSDLAGHCGRPPALPDCSLIWSERRKNGTPVYDHDDGQRYQEEEVPDHVDDVANPLRHHAVEDVDPDVLVIEQRPGRAQQEHDAEKHPLQLEPRVGGRVQRLSNNRIQRRDDDGNQDQPRQALARPTCERVNSIAQLQERLQDWSSPICPGRLDCAEWRVGLSRRAGMRQPHQTSERAASQSEVC